MKFLLLIFPLAAFGGASDRLSGFAPAAPVAAEAASESEIIKKRDAIIEKYSGRTKNADAVSAPPAPPAVQSDPAFPAPDPKAERPKGAQLAGPERPPLQLPVLFIGHTPETLHSARIFRNSAGQYFLNVEAAFYSGQFGFDFGSLLGPLKLKPRAAFGLISELSGPGEKTAYTAINAALQKENHGLGIKLVARLKTGEGFLKPLAAGNLAAYYFVNLTGILGKWDFVSAYAGWFSSPAAFDFASKADLFSAARDLAGGGWENLLAGVFYNPDVARPLGAGIEAGPGLISASVYVGIK